ncbi:hypothetical protein [Candidatus Lokiarchaeum ossiferum]|uniref:hypothetical protein n=1 Tax=Candidatus Lokiarchaeum ossiferum TaxID=2951803 RepID=UPI00352CA18C
MSEDFFKTTSVNDFKLKNIGHPPAGYNVQKTQDIYSKEPFKQKYSERKQAFISHCLQNPGSDAIKGYFYELVRISEIRGPIWLGLLESALSYIDSRFDCSDFVLLGIMRLCYQFSKNPLVTPDLLKNAKKTILSFKYWPDEPGTDSMCYWTENHHIMFASNEYLAGQLYPNEFFSNSKMTGEEKMVKARKRILKWFELRFYTGFNEWLSNIYYDEDMTALLNLIDFCEDEEIVRKAKIIMDLMLFDMALNSYYGQFVSTHGRCYAAEKKNALVESTIDTMKLVFGMGNFANKDNMSAVTLALSEKYTPPEVIMDIAQDISRAEMENRQRVSINIREARRWGINYKDVDNGLILLSFESYVHPKTINVMVKMLDRFRWWDNEFFQEFKPFKHVLQIGRYFGLTKALAHMFKKDLTRNTREENNIYTYRTPDYMLSSSQDYRKGYGGDQQHIWQASLGPEAVCFTTHPGGYGNTSPEGYWLGSGYLPRVAQVKNVLIAVYKIPRMGGILLSKNLRFTHAWFPKSKFDEVIEKNGWVCARYQNGFLALFSQNTYQWQVEGEEKDKDLIVDGRQNIWIIELGRKDQYQSFSNFVDSVTTSKLIFGKLSVQYTSPSQGLLEFGWKGDLKQNGQNVSLKNYPRYENPYSHTSFGAKKVHIEHSEQHLDLEFEK